MRVNRDDKYIYIFIGTEAELIKLFPIILLLKKNNISYKIISSGQNDILNSNILKIVNDGKVDIILSDSKKIKKSVYGLLSWFIKTYLKSIKILKKSENLKESILILHGDTVSTVMGALLGNKFKMNIAHVEAGYRSYDFFNPFPEEIDRVLTSKYARLHFAPSQLAYDNLKKIKGQKYNTQYNTIIDSMRYSNNINIQPDVIKRISNNKYFVFIMHRQENLANKELVKSVINKIMEISINIKCVFILHEPTEIKLKNYNLLRLLKENNSIITTPRLEYFEFMKLIEKSEFVITDGGSNQQELFYMGKPCLILRKKTEQSEGIGGNAILYNKNINMIKEFSLNYYNYKSAGADSSISPSEMIVNILQENIFIEQ